MVLGALCMCSRCMCVCMIALSLRRCTHTQTHTHITHMYVRVWMCRGWKNPPFYIESCERTALCMLAAAPNNNNNNIAARMPPCSSFSLCSAARLVSLHVHDRACMHGMLVLKGQTGNSRARSRASWSLRTRPLALHTQAHTNMNGCVYSPHL